MAKQASSIFKLRGRIEDLSFYKSQDGFLARTKGGVSGDRIKSDPKFDRTRRHGQEFGIGGRAGKLFRKVWKNEIPKASDNRLASRVTQLMMRVLQSDTASEFGSRQVYLGDLTLLNGFEFNNEVSLDQVLNVELTTSYDRPTGIVSVVLPARIPTQDVVMPEGNSHYQVFAAAAAIDFEQGTFTVVRQETANLLWDDTPAAAVPIDMDLPGNSTLPVFIITGVQFLRIVNGRPYPGSQGQSTLQVVTVDMP